MSEEIDQLNCQEPQQTNKVQDQKDPTAKNNFWKKIFISSTIVSALLIAFIIILFLVILPSQQTSYIKYEDETLHSIYNPHTKDQEDVKVTRMKYVHRKSKIEIDDDDMDDGEQFEIRYVQPSKNGRQLQSADNQTNSSLSCLHTDVGNTTTYVQCNDGSIQILNQDIKEVFDNDQGVLRILMEQYERTLQEFQNEENSTSSNSTLNNTNTDYGNQTFQLEDGLIANIQPVQIVTVNSTVLKTEQLNQEIPLPDNNNSTAQVKRFLQMFENNLEEVIEKQYGHLDLADRRRMLGFWKKVGKALKKAAKAVLKVAQIVMPVACYLQVASPASCIISYALQAYSAYETVRTCSMKGVKNQQCYLPAAQAVGGVAFGGFTSFTAQGQQLQAKVIRFADPKLMAVGLK